MIATEIQGEFALINCDFSDRREPPSKARIMIVAAYDWQHCWLLTDREARELAHVILSTCQPTFSNGELRP